MEPTIKESLYLLFRIIGVMQEIIPSCKETKNIIKEKIDKGVNIFSFWAVRIFTLTIIPTFRCFFLL